MVDVFCYMCGLVREASKEHHFPKWSRKQLPIVKTNSFNYGVGGLHNKDTGVRTLNRICKVCNEGWMSKLQDTAKPIITDLFETGDTAKIVKQDRETLAKWFTMTSMAFESDHPEGRVAVPEIERQRFSANQIIGPTWRIWIGSVMNDVKGGRGISHLPNSNGTILIQRTIM